MPDYLLGHSDREWSRLDEQHALWRDGLLATLGELGLPAGARIVEVGCGNGALLADLASLGHVTGVERDPGAAALAAARTGRPVIAGDLFDVDLPAADLVVARWVFSFLPDAERAVARLARCLAPGGRLVIQDYDHDALGVWPRHPAIDRVVEAYRAAYRDSGGDLWIGARLPQLLLRRGFSDLRVVPEVKASLVDGPAWRWVERFLVGHLHTIVASGHLGEDDAHAFHAAWAETRAIPGAMLVTPAQLTVTGRLANPV